MKIVRPAIIDDAALVASNLAETVAAYNPATTYALGAQVRDDATHRLFESGAAGNVGHPLTDPAYWIDIGPTNRWAMFDTKNGTVSTGATSIDVTLQPMGRIDTLALLNVEAALIEVTVTDDADGEIFDQSFTMVADSGIIDWYAYFYEPIIRKTDLVIADIPLYAAPQVQVLVTSGGDPVSCGTLIMGQSKDIGDAQHGASIGITDYSRKAADEFGNYTVVERAFSRRGTFSVAVEPGLLDEVYRILSGYRATPILYIGSDAFGSTAIFGFYKDFNVEITYPTLVFCSLELEGLT